MLLIRTIILIVIVALFIRQARCAPARSRKQRAFGLASAAIGLFALLHLLLVPGIDISPLLLPIQTIATLLLAISLLFLLQAWRNGEMDEQINEVRAAFERERERRKE